MLLNIDRWWTRTVTTYVVLGLLSKASHTGRDSMFLLQPGSPRPAVLKWGCSHPQGVREGTSWCANFSDNTKDNTSNGAKMIFTSGRGADFKIN